MLIKRFQSLYFITTLVLLAACGGGASDTGDSVDLNPDTIAPTITFNAAKKVGYSNEVITVSASAQDSHDGSVKVTLTCERGKLNGDQLTLPEVSAELTFTCTARANDSTGNQATESLSILVKPLYLVQSDITPNANIGALLMLDLIGPVTAGSSELTANIDNVDVTLVPIDTSRFALLLPDSLSAGSKTLSVDYLGNTLSLDVELLAIKHIEDPRTYLNNYLQNSLSDLESKRADADYGSYVETIIGDVNQLLIHIETLPESDIKTLATFYQQNRLQEEVVRYSNFSSATNKELNFVQQQSLDCIYISPFLKSSVKTIFYAGLTGVIAPTIAAPVVGIASLGVSVYTAYNAIENLSLWIAAAKNIVEHCIVPQGASLETSAQVKSNIISATKRISAQLVKSADSSYDFNEKVSRRFKLVTTFRLSNEEYHNHFVSYATAIKDLVNKYFPSELGVAIASVPSTDEKTELLNPSNLQLIDISKTNINGAFWALNEEEFTLKFNFKELSNVANGGVTSFTFKLVDPTQDVDLFFNANSYVGS